MKKMRSIIIFSVMGAIALYGCKKDSVSNEFGASNAAKAAQQGETNSGTVYVLSNQASGNSVLVYNRSATGILSASGSFPTGGTGTGSGLGSQGSVILQQRDRNSYLYAINAGSNDVTVFRVDGNGLTLIDRVPTHGTLPISVTAHSDLLYVLNAGGSGNISGFHIESDGHLEFLENSTRALSNSDAGPAQIQFNNAGTQIVVTEKNNNAISTFTVQNSGVTDNAVSHPSIGITPFGFAFDNHDQLIVTDAFGGAVGQSAVTLFSLNNSGNLSLIDGPVGSNQNSVCWIAVTNNGKYGYATNTGSASITGYAIRDGKLSLLNANGVTATTGTTPIDVSLSSNSHFLYNVNSTSHSITEFRVNEDGSLDAIGSIDNLPDGAVGIASN